MHHHLNFGVAILLLSALLAGCMVGPDFHAPRSPVVTRYTEYPQPKKTTYIKAAGRGGKTQYFRSGEDIPSQWWRLFRSPAINAMVCKGMAQSPTITSAREALVQAEETLNAQIGSTMLPSFTYTLAGERQLTPVLSAGGSAASPATAATASGANPTGTIFNLFNATVNVAYTLDIFGGLRRQIEQLGAQVDFQCFELHAAYLTLTSNIVTTAITIASLREQIKSTRELIKLQRDSLHIIKGQFQLGGASNADVLQQESQLAATIATLPPLAQSLAQNLHALSVLLGELPSHNQLPKIDLNHLHLPTDLPISLPTLLVRQRPDIRASEALMHSAMAQIGVATANLYPSLNLTGQYGWQSLVASALGRTATKMWNYAGTLTGPIFNGGALMATRRAAIAAYRQALANYELTVLQAFQNVADALRAIEHDAQALKAIKDAEIAAKRSLTLTQYQYKLGGVNYLSLLIAQRQYHLATINRIRAQAARYTDTVALFQALGGGWWNKPPPIEPCCGYFRIETLPSPSHECKAGSHSCHKNLSPRNGCGVGMIA